MPVGVPLFQEVFQRISSTVRIRKTSVRRLVLLVCGIIAAKSAVIAQVAAELSTLELTNATRSESIERTLRRTLADRRLNSRDCYEPVLQGVLDWNALLRGCKRVILSIDESTKKDMLHLFRVSITFWGNALPMASALWEQNVKLPEGTYWTEVDAILARVALMLPPGLEVIVVADRAYDIPPFVDRIHSYGWHWIVRLKANGTGHFRDRMGCEYELADLIAHHLRRPGLRWKTRGQLFKDAGWRTASVVGLWALGYKEPVVVISDLPPRWELLEWYERRFWIEPGFRSEKRRGWQWEDTQVVGIEHNERLLLAMALASLIVLCVGLDKAKERLAEVAQPSTTTSKTAPLPRHARSSIFTMGLREIRRWIYKTARRAITWLIDQLDADSWDHRWYAYQSNRYIFKTVRP